jgi:hypothetical protein
MEMASPAKRSKDDTFNGHELAERRFCNSGPAQVSGKSAGQAEAKKTVTLVTIAI